MDMDFRHYYDEETKVLRMPGKDVSLHPGGLGAYLYENAQQHLNKEAQVDLTTGERETYDSFLKRCSYAAMELRTQGVSSEDRISICSHNQMDTAVAFMATIFIGAKPACLDPSLSLADTTYLMKLVTPKVVFASEESENLVTQAAKAGSPDTQIYVFTKNEAKQNSFAIFVKSRDIDNFEVYKVKSLEEVAIILFSSGTTGLPKGICISHKALIYNVENIMFAVNSILIFASLYWISNVYGTLVMQRYGTCKMLCKEFDEVETWMNIEKYKISSLFLAPCNAITFINKMPIGHVCTLQNLIIGGSSLSNDYLKKFQKALPNTILNYGYGQSEALNIARPTYRNDKLGSVGVPNDGVSYKVVHPETEKNVGLNEEGELRIKCDYIMTGYYNLDSSDAWDADGFLKTGDIVYFDDDFHLYIVDRIKEMFKYKSWHIVPTQIEAIIQKHDDVKFASVVGIPHPEDDNHIKAIVELKDNRTADPEEIRMFADKLLDDRHKLRAGLSITKKIPITPTGKIQRRVLRNLVINGQI